MNLISASSHVCYWMESGHHVLTASISGIDPNLTLESHFKSALPKTQKVVTPRATDGYRGLIVGISPECCLMSAHTHAEIRRETTI